MTSGQRHACLLSLGANMGDAKKTFARAVEKLSALGTVGQQSALYGSEPWGFESPDNFTNQVVELHTCLDPQALLVRLQQIEKELGRTAKTEGGQYASRTIDIDILFYDDAVLETPALVIPHPLLHRRRFVLVPLCERWSGHVHPAIGLSAASLLKMCDDCGRVWKIEE